MEIILDAIDKNITDLSDRTMMGTDEVIDMLLDLRQLVAVVEPTDG